MKTDKQRREIGLRKMITMRRLGIKPAPSATSHEGRFGGEEAGSEEIKRLGRIGGKKAQALGVGHKWTKEEASEAAKKSHENRGKKPEPVRIDLLMRG